MLTRKVRTATVTKRASRAAKAGFGRPHAPPAEEEVLGLILGELPSVCNRWIRLPVAK